MTKIFLKNKFKDSIYLLLGTLFIALSVVLFFLPNNITTGGTPGMAILLHHVSGFSIGSMIIAINVPLLIWGGKYLGKIFAIKTIIAIVLISIFIDLFSRLFTFEPLTSNILLASVFGGLIIGLGVGFIIKAHASAGGSTIIARIVSANSHIKAAQVILYIDIVIVISSIYVFKDFEKALHYYEDLINNHSDYVGTYYHLGKLYEAVGRSEDAINTYKNGMEVCRKAGDMHAFSELQGVLNSALGLDYEDD